MKFHGVNMVGPFTNQKLESLPEPWVDSRDQGRLVWLNNGTLWYGTDTEFVNFASGSGDASEVEDMYSDLLRTTIFMNASYDGFVVKEDELDELVDKANTNMTYHEKESWYTFSTGETITSLNLFDTGVNLEFVDYFMIYVDYIEIGNNAPIFEVTTDGGVNWTTVDLLKTIKIPNSQAGKDVRLRFTSGGAGTLNSWGVLYNKDLSAACTRWGLTYANFEPEFDGQTTFELTYVPKAIQVFLNGDLLDVSDYTAEDGMTVVFPVGLKMTDIVYVISYSTSVLDPNFDEFELIHKNGSVVWTNDQSVGGNKLIDLKAGENDGDAVNLKQLQDTITGVDHSVFITKSGNVPYTGPQSMGGNNVTNMADGLDPQNAVNKSQLDGVETKADANTTKTDINTESLVSIIDMLGTPQEIRGGDITISGNVLVVTPCTCLDSTLLNKMVTLSPTPITLPTLPTDHASYHIYIVRDTSTQVCTIKSYPTENGVLSDGTIDVFRWLDFWNTDDNGLPVPSKTYSGIKYFNEISDLHVMSGISLPSWSPIDLSSIVPVDKIVSWLPGATWTGGATNLPASSSQLHLSHDGVNAHCAISNYLDTAASHFWGSVNSHSKVITALPPVGISVRRTSADGTGESTGTNIWSVSFQKIYLKR